MNAVTTKPRAKAKPKAAPSPEQTLFASIMSRLQIGQNKLRLAHQSVEATDVGEPVEVLLGFVTDNMLPEALAQLSIVPVTREALAEVYTGMFPALAALEGVIALAAGSVIEAILREAHFLLDTGNADMDSPDLARMLPRRADGTEANFLRGRDLAIAMIEVGDDVAFSDPDSATPYRAYRYGKEQARFTAPFLLQLQADPSMLDGFNAVLSAKLADESIVEASFYRFSMAEYSAGEVGADGTAADPLGTKVTP